MVEFTINTITFLFCMFAIGAAFGLFILLPISLFVGWMTNDDYMDR